MLEERLALLSKTVKKELPGKATNVAIVTSLIYYLSLLMKTRETEVFNRFTY